MCALPLAIGTIAAALTGGASAQDPPAETDTTITTETTVTQEPPPNLAFTVSMRRPKAFFDSTRIARFRYRFEGDQPYDMEIQLIRPKTGNVKNTWIVPAVTPGELHIQTWDGLTDAGTQAGKGRYRFRIRPVGALDWSAGASFHWYRHFFPVRGRHWSRGAIGEFGAPRSGGRRHLGYDVVAPCGTPLAAARGGVVQKRGYRPNLDGNFIVIDGRDTDYDYWYAHLKYPSWAEVGQRVPTRQQIGRVGKTGNARSVGCHLHFELWKGGYPNGHPVDPKPFLRAWDSWS
jgi:murein DD-endopeptidase MepM/ murein hydrolase activator NlpD